MPSVKRRSPSKQSQATSIPEALRKSTEERIRRHAEKHFAGKYAKLDIRFEGELCYIDCYEVPSLPRGWKAWIDDPEQYLEDLRQTPMHLCRLRYVGEAKRWQFDIFAYSNESYEQTVFPTGDWLGAPEQAFDLAATLYLS